ncbi:MAG: transporter [Planctomyces sp.]|nr:transporter [Planctomyces sp.]MBA4119497.1 transporter [Isosphaera sp.]
MRAHEPLPTEQHPYPGLPPLSPRVAHARRETVFLLLAGLFLGTLAMLNILGITKFIDLSFVVLGVRVPMVVAVGVLPYPLTFLVTDFISELYGQKRANRVVWVGLLLNGWVMTILWLGSVLPPTPPTDPATGAALRDAAGRLPVFDEVKSLAFGAVAASMLAYLTAQFVDVYVFHFWMRISRGKHRWLRNNGSTLTSQLVDSTAVILITHFFARALPVDAAAALWPQLLTFIASSYLFKLVAALLDTLPFYLGSAWLSRYLRLPPAEEQFGTLLSQPAPAAGPTPDQTGLTH